MQNQTILIVPAWVVNTLHFIKDNWTVATAVVVVAVLASIVVELLKRRYKAKHQLVTAEDTARLKKLIAWLLVVFTTLFSWLGYVLLFATSNVSLLQSLPIVGQHALEAIAVAYTLYNLRLNKWYKSFAVWASKWSKAPVDTEGVHSLDPSGEVNSDQFLGQ